LDDSFKINNFYIRSCAILDDIIRELGYSKIIIVEKDQLKNVKNNSIANKISFRRFFL